MGTPEFAVPSLRILVENGYNVLAVVTAPDKPKGRGKKLAISPVKAYCLENNLPVLQPTNLKSPEFITELSAYNANLQVVVAFRMLPVIVWDMPEIGTFNLHASLLPHYRGAAPINWAIINGETETGVTTFFLKHEIDTGNIIFQEKETIDAQDNAGTLYSRLMHKGADLVLKTVEAIQQESFTSLPQQTSADIKHAPKIFKEDCEIQWSKSNRDVLNFIRGLAPYPGAWCYLNQQFYKIYEATSTEDCAGLKLPGEFLVKDKKLLIIKTKDGCVKINELQLQGKKRMNIEDFLRGNEL